MRLPEELTEELRDLCHVRGWHMKETIKEFLTIGLLISKHPEIHNQFNKILESSDIVDVARPDYVQLAIKQYKDIVNQQEIKQIQTQEPLTKLSIPLKALQMFRQKEIEV